MPDFVVYGDPCYQRPVIGEQTVISRGFCPIGVVSSQARAIWRTFPVLASLAAYPAPAWPLALPFGFAQSQVGSRLVGATSMSFAPDGRLFVSEELGTLRIIKDGVLLPTPFLTVDADNTTERGLSGIAFDPE